MWTLIVLPLATLAVAWLASQINPAFVSRYFAPVLAPMLQPGHDHEALAQVVDRLGIVVADLLLEDVHAHLSTSSAQTSID